MRIISKHTLNRLYLSTGVFGAFFWVASSRVSNAQLFDEYATNIVSSVYYFARGIAIGLGIILIITSSYKIMTSQGDPQKVKSGKESLTSAIIGLIFVIMAVVTLNYLVETVVLGI